MKIRQVADHPTAERLSIASLSTEFPNPCETGKGLFIRARLQAVAAKAHLTVVAPVALLDYANPQNNLLASLRIPKRRRDGRLEVLHPRWIYPPYGGWLNAFFLFARLLPPIARLRSRNACDLIDAHFAHPEGIAAALLSGLFDVPFIVTIRGSELRYQQHRWKRHWMGWALRRASRVIAVSENLFALAMELGVERRRAAVVPNGINPDVFFQRDQAVCRHRHGIDSGARVILCAGDLAELKGHHRVIVAVKALRASGTAATLLIAGGVGRSGRYAASLRDLVNQNALGDCVSFLGEVQQAALAELMCAADVFCLASSTEGWPNVVNEALACGTPVVATDVGAVRRMIVSPDFGLIVSVGDEQALVAALGVALKRTWNRNAISAHGRSRSWDQVADQVVELARSAIAEQRAE